MSYNFKFIYPFNQKPLSIRQTLNKLLIPRKWQHYLRVKKQILVNDQYRNFNELIKPNETVTLSLDFVTSKQQAYPASGKLPKIAYEDDNILVINKPQGQKTHPNLNETNTALNDCATYLKTSPYIVHRLDMLTQGLLLVAKNPAVVPILNRQLTKKIMQRDYFATVKLTDIPEFGTINRPIGPDPSDQRKRMIRSDGLKAITHYQVVQKDVAKKTMILKISLETGRTHQIRVHLASLGIPIIGDPLYNPAYQGEDLALTAYKMKLIKPFSFDELTIKLK